MIEVKNLYAGYGKKEVLRGIDLKAAQGSITTILGANGSGKSTLLKTMMGALPVSRGEILLSGREIGDMKPQEVAKLMAYLPQCKNPPDMTAGRLVLHGRFPHLSYPRKYSKNDLEIAAKAMEEMEVSRWEHTPLGELSGGMRQRVYLAMLLAQQSPIILMDEPTTYLDLGQQKKFVHLARSLVGQGKTLLLVLHDILLALKLSDQIVVLDEGSIIASGTSEQMLESRVLHDLYGIDIGCANGQYYFCID